MRAAVEADGTVADRPRPSTTQRDPSAPLRYAQEMRCFAQDTDDGPKMNAPEQLSGQDRHDLTEYTLGWLTAQLRHEAACASCT